MEANVKVLARIAVVTATLAALVAGAPAAGADTTWTKISTDYNANIVVPSLGLIGTTAVVAWTQQTSPLHDRYRHGQLHDLADAGRDRRRVQPRSRRAGRDRLHARALPGSRRRPPADLQRHPLDHYRRPADRDGDDAPQRRRQLGGALRRLGVELRADDRRALGLHAARRGLRHRRASRSSTRPWPMRREHPTRTCSPSSAAAAATSRAWRSTAPAISGSRGTRTRRAPRACTCSSSIRSTGAPIGAPALAPNSESCNNNSFGANLACAATCRLVYGNSPAAGPSDTDRLLVAGSGCADHDREPGRHRAGRRARADRRVPRRRAPLGRLVRRQDLPRDARRRHRGRRRGAGCGRAQGLARRRLRAHRASPSATTSCWRRTTPGTRPGRCRSRSS